MKSCSCGDLIVSTQAMCRNCAVREDEDLRRLAQEVTDEVLGQGVYAQVNNLARPLTIQEEPDGR